jgi:hypothetical protein
MPELDLKVSEDTERLLKDALNPSQFRRAIFQVVNRTTSKLAVAVRKVVKNSTTLPPSYIAEHNLVKVVKPQGDPPVGEVRVKKEPTPASAFKYVNMGRRGGGVSFQTLKGGNQIKLAHAFLATMKSGHVGIYLRAAKGDQKTGGVFAQVNARSNVKLWTAAGYAERLPIKEEFGPSVYSVVNKRADQITLDAQAEMAKQAASQISRFTKREPIQDSD